MQNGMGTHLNCPVYLVFAVFLWTACIPTSNTVTHYTLAVDINGEPGRGWGGSLAPKMQLSPHPKIYWVRIRR